MKPPNSMDDFFDVQSAFKKYDKYFTKWMNAEGPATEETKKHARIAMRALVELRNAADYALRNFEEDGWGRVIPATKILPDRTQDFLDGKINADGTPVKSETKKAKKKAKKE